MMRPTQGPVFRCREPIDFHLAINGLSLRVEQHLSMNPFESALYAFSNRHKNRINILDWEKNGFCHRRTVSVAGQAIAPSAAEDSARQCRGVSQHVLAEAGSLSGARRPADRQQSCGECHPAVCDWSQELAVLRYAGRRPRQCAPLRPHRNRESQRTRPPPPGCVMSWQNYPRRKT